MIEFLRLNLVGGAEGHVFINPAQIVAVAPYQPGTSVVVTTGINNSGGAYNFLVEGTPDEIAKKVGGYRS